MSETAIMTRAIAGEEFAGKPPAIYRPVLAVAVVVALGLWLLLRLDAAEGTSSWGLGAWIRGSGAPVQEQGVGAALGAQSEAFVQRLFTVAAASGLAVLAMVLAGLALWRQAWVRHLRKREEHWRVQKARLEFQRAGGRKLDEEERRILMAEVLQESEARIQAQVADLAEQKARLQSELDQRKKSEQSLSQQRQVLESSKTVLELHVEARTQELHNLKHRYELILNSAGEGICGLDLAGQVTFVNPAVGQLTGWSLEELTGKTERELLCRQNAEGQAPPAEANSGEQMFCRKDGSRFPAEFVRTRIEEYGRQTGSVLIFKDVTERRRAEEVLGQKAAELVRSNAELEQFAFVASHDLQEPLRKIQAFGDRLKVKCESVLPPEALDYLQRMQNASARMRTLIDDLLAFSRVIRSSEPFVALDLGRIAREVLGDLEVRLEKSGGQVELGELPAVEADATQMRQLLLNLIGNALKFQPAGTRPVVKVQGRKFISGSGQEFCELTVQDNGIGFEEQYAEKIFAVFQRLHGRGEYEGTGIGLAVCRRITDRHQGTIIARSQPGCGATFIVTLPLRQPRQEPTT